MYNIQAHCQCGFTRDRISNETFRCISQAVTYSAIIHGTATSTSSQLISYIERWIGEETAAITLHQVRLSVETSCTVHTMVTEPEDQVTMAKDPKKDQNRILLVGITTSGLAAFILASAVIVLVILLVRKKHHAQAYTTDNDVYDRINRYPVATTGCSRSVHKQKILDVPVYGNIQLGNANKCDSEKIEFSRCPAYEDTLPKETSQ